MKVINLNLIAKLLLIYLISFGASLTVNAQTGAVGYGTPGSTGSSSASAVDSTAIGGYSTASAVDATALGNGATASGVGSIAIGSGSGAAFTQASGTGSIAIGAASSATGTNSIAIGAGVTSTTNNAIVIGDSSSATIIGGTLSTTGNVTLGSGPSATVTVGNQNGSGVGTSTVSFNNNRLQNVAAATALTDAVNLGQVNSLITSSTSTFQNQITSVQNQVNNLQNQVNQNNLQAQRGIAGVGAIAGIPALESGKNFGVGVGVGNYISASAISVGVQARISESTVAKIAASTTNYGGVVTTAGIGFSF